MKILIVDDEKLARLNIVAQLDQGIDIVEASSFEKALSELNKHNFDICFIDLKLDDSKELLGLKLIPIAIQKGFYTVVMTSIQDEHVLETAYSLGCQDVYNKGLEKKHISETLNHYFLTKESFTEGYLFRDIIQTQNKKYKEELKKLLKVISVGMPICLLGEMGSGKSHLAKAIHHLSKQKGKFIELNCESLNTDELKRQLTEAERGTIFLDKINSLSLNLQEYLLEAIEKDNFRVISSSEINLETLIKKGKFEFDLFQRITSYTFNQPSLRNRKDDILPLLKSMLLSSKKIIFKEDAKKILENHEWRGNFLELNKCAEMISLSNARVITAEDAIELINSSTFKRSRSLINDEHYDLIRKVGLKEFLEILTREIVIKSLEENDNKARLAIKELKIGNGTFYRYYDKKDSNKFTPKMNNQEFEHELH